MFFILLVVFVRKFRYFCFKTHFLWFFFSRFKFFLYLVRNSKKYSRYFFFHLTKLCRNILILNWWIETNLKKKLRFRDRKILWINIFKLENKTALMNLIIKENEKWKIRKSDKNSNKRKSSNFHIWMLFCNYLKNGRSIHKIINLQDFSTVKNKIWYFISIQMFSNLFILYNVYVCQYYNFVSFIIGQRLCSFMD